MFSEQAVREDGSIRLKTKEDGMGSDILQNPADPDATFREKAGKQHRGYAANVTESVGEAGSIVTDYQYEQNNHSDREFLKEHLESAEKRPEQVTLVTDGAYSGKENRRLAQEKNIDLVTTNLTGKVRASFPKNMCENCPYKDQCQPKISNKTSRVYVTKAAHERALSQRFRKTWQFEFLSRVRNGVETVPSILRRRYHIDIMPVRGKIRTKHMFGFKIGALNFRKLLKYLSSREKCALNPETV